MSKLAIRRLRVIPVPRGETGETGETGEDGETAKEKLVVLAELAKIGVRLAGSERLDNASPSFYEGFRGVVETIAALRGGDVDYVPLFVNFPDDVPDDDTYFAKRIVGYLANTFELFDSGEQLETGTVIPEWLFDLKRFGADPVTQFQSKSLWDKAKDLLAKRAPDTHVEWIDFETVWANDVPDRLRQWGRDCLYARSSIKEALHADLDELLVLFGTEWIDFEQIVIKENRALVMRLLWLANKPNEAAALAKTPTDLLRLFAALTDTPVSLAKPIKFPKFSRAQRRIVLGVLERSASLAEDLKRYKGLWLELGRYIHPGEYKSKYPKSFAAFDALRNGRIETFNGRTEALLSGENVSPVLMHLAARPGVLARKVHELLRRFPEGHPMILDAFATTASQMTIKNLLVLASYFAVINDEANRTIINKRGSIKIVPNNSLGALPVTTLSALGSLLEKSLTTAIGERESWEGKTAWIDPVLANYTVPLAQRAASDGLVTVGRGTRLPIALGKVLRLFVYWKQAALRTDLDLSVIQFGDNFEYIGHVSYTNLSAGGIVHSGDIQSAPHGATEFVDISLSGVDSKVRYLATQVHRYAGESFAQMDCHAGWMVRSDINADTATFDIKTVANKFDLNGEAGYCVPLAIDLKQSQVLMTDLYMGNKAFHNNVEGTFGAVSKALRAVARFTETRPTMKTLAELHVRARQAERIDQREPGNADISFGVSGCTFDATNVEAILAELL